MHTLHYIFDPLCGWCYAAAPLISAARSVPGLRIAFHGGGMMTGPGRRTITPQWRDHVIPHDKRIAQLTGLPFGAAYLDGLLHDTSAVMDSAPPTTAILAAEELAGRGLDMLHREHQAHYVEGRRAATFARLEGAATERHFSESREWLARSGGQGFPTVVLEQADGTLERIDIGPWLGRADAWREYLLQQGPGEAASEAPVGNPVCGVDSCAI
jgi:putative protein-disulfide isomerase